MEKWQQIDLAYQSDASHFFRHLLEYNCPIWLDSCSHATNGRYDIITVAPHETLIQQLDGKLCCSNGAVIDAHEQDLLAVLKQYFTLQSFQYNDLTFSGVVGYFSYEFGVKRAGIVCSNPSMHQVPDAWFGIYSWVVIIDHHTKTAALFYYQEPADGALSITKLTDLWQNSSLELLSLPAFSLKAPFQPNIHFDDYAHAFSQIKRNLRAGNTYQVNYSHCFQTSFEGETFSAYVALRQKNPSEFAAFMRLPFADILSLSPELLVLGKADKLVTKPIKGTAARAFDEIKDIEIIKALKNCPKNKAENTMIVDLLRNDMSQVATVDSVDVTQYLNIEIMPSVFHLVSTISASLAAEFNYFDVLNALLPGGSITGAPKHSTMKIIENLETQARGMYCGSIGYLSPGQQMCFNIAIRTITAAKGKLFCNAGGGIVLDSSVNDEYQETFDKVAVLTKTLQDLSIHDGQALGES